MKCSYFALAIAGLVATPLAAAPQIGQPAPDFVARDASGKPVKLSDYRGKTVVIEWNNPGCPFVQKHYNSGNMQGTQARAKAAGAVWLSVNSGAPGEQGHMLGPQATAWLKSIKSAPSAYLLDPEGAVGHRYTARTTPQMFVVDAGGVLRYQGGIDDKPTANPADIKVARNHVLAALGEMKAGKPVSVAETRPYGCSVKYKS